jgi:hypothetical protein
VEKQYFSSQLGTSLAKNTEKLIFLSWKDYFSQVASEQTRQCISIAAIWLIE